MKHKHHIIPKHMGGNNHPSNIIELTVEEHAEAHRLLYEQHNKWQDHVAWRCLSGQITTDEARRQAASNSNRGRTCSDETREKIREARKKQVCTEETRKKMSETRKNIHIWWDFKRVSPEANAKRSAAMKGRKQQTFQCPHCLKTGGNTMFRWHFDNCKEK